jgi:hypothetical protein
MDGTGLIKRSRVGTEEFRSQLKQIPRAWIDVLHLSEVIAVGSGLKSDGAWSRF